MYINFNAKFDEQTNNELAELKVMAKQSKASIVRSLIADRFTMLTRRTPICVDGGTCRCPHAHIYGAERGAPPPDPDRLL